MLFVGTGLWTWLTLPWAYSDGTRAGVLQKFSRRGWLCKTQEGDLALYYGGVVPPQIWQFSVRDPAVGAQIEKAVGARVQLHYTEHPGVPSTCFADTRYFVDRVTVTDPLPALTGTGARRRRAPAPRRRCTARGSAPPRTPPAAAAPPPPPASADLAAVLTRSGRRSRPRHLLGDASPRR